MQTHSNPEQTSNDGHSELINRTIPGRSSDHDVPSPETDVSVVLGETVSQVHRKLIQTLALQSSSSHSLTQQHWNLRTLYSNIMSRRVWDRKESQ